MADGALEHDMKPTEEVSVRDVFGIDTDMVVKGFPQRTSRCLLYTSPSPRDRTRSRMPSSA